jgi:hypothetical protein
MMGPLRWVIAVAVWAAAVAGAAGLGKVASDHADSATASSTTATTKPRSDVTTSIPPPPTPTAPGPLFDKNDLATVLAQVTGRYGADADIVQFALYPTEADFVVADVADDGLVVRARLDEPLKVEEGVPFSGTRTAVSLKQIRADYLHKILVAVRQRADVPADGIARVELDLDSFGNDNAGYQVITTDGRSYGSLLTGGNGVINPPG